MQIHSPKISIVIPCYNQESYIEECLLSILNQDFQDYEVILINDNCNDSTFAKVEKLICDDRRFKIINFERNKGTCKARKEGIKLSSGDFVIFLDPDDSLSKNALAIMYQNAIQKNVDIMQFGINVVNYGTDDFIHFYFEKKSRPYKKKMVNKNIFFACFEKKLFIFNLWNKIYKGELIRQAFSSVKDGYYTMGEDAYAFAIISYFAKSYDYIENKLYIYNFGRGITGNHKSNTLTKFFDITTQLKIAELFYKFIDEQAPHNLKRYINVVNKIFDDFFNNVIKNYLLLENFETDKFKAEELIIDSLVPIFTKESYKNTLIFDEFLRKISQARKKLSNVVKDKNLDKKQKRKCLLSLPFKALKVFIKCWKSAGFKYACRETKIGIAYVLKKNKKL